MITPCLGTLTLGTCGRQRWGTMMADAGCLRYSRRALDRSGPRRRLMPSTAALDVNIPSTLPQISMEAQEGHTYIYIYRGVVILNGAPLHFHVNLEECRPFGSELHVEW